jgi:hypothetical protein
MTLQVLHKQQRDQIPSEEDPHLCSLFVILSGRSLRSEGSGRAARLPRVLCARNDRALGSLPCQIAPKSYAAGDLLILITNPKIRNH